MTSSKYFLGKNIPSRQSMSKAFTLIEVMVAVLIISLVIMALLQMRGNSSHMLMNINKQIKVNQFNSFLISNNDYGFESKSTTLDRLLSEFSMENNLRRELKKIKVKIKYQELETINMDSNIIFEIGKVVLKVDEESTSVVRLRLQ